MKRSYTYIVFFLAFLCLSAVLAGGCGEEGSRKNAVANEEKEKAEAEEDCVTIGVIGLINGNMVVRDQGWYEQELGTKVKIKEYHTGMEVVDALGKAEIDIGELGSPPAAAAISHGYKIDVIYVEDIIGAAETLVVRKDAGISNIKDLLGKTVGTPYGSTAHYSLLKAMRLEGMDANAVHVLDLKPKSIYAAWQHGDIDAAYIWYPVLGQLLADGGAVLTDSGELAGRGIITADVLVARHAFAEKHEAEVQKVVDLNIRATKMLTDGDETAYAAIARQMNMSLEEARQETGKFKYLDPEEQAEYLSDVMGHSLNDIADFMLHQQLVLSVPEPGEYMKRVEPRYVKEAIRK